MNELQVKGTQEFLGKTIKVVEGGFGENQRVVTVKDVSEIHKEELGELNRLINRNITRFGEHDLINLLNGSETFRNFAKENGLIGSNRTKDVFVLSERGYTKLVAMMDNSNEKKWEVMDKLIDEYFTMRKVINSNEQLKANLLLSIYNGGQEGVLASKQLTEMEIKEATTPLLAKIEEDRPLVGFAETALKSSDNILVRELAKIATGEGVKIGERGLYNLLREWKLIMKGKTEPYQTAMNKGYFVVEEKNIIVGGKVKLTKTTKVTPLGQVKIVEKLKKEYNVN